MSNERAFSITCSIALSVILVCATDPVFAGTYTVDLGFEQYIEQNDNIDFTVDDEIDATAYILTPHVGFNGQTARWLLGATLETPFERYTESRLDSDNQDLSVTGERTLERGSFGVDAAMRRDSTHLIDDSGIVERIADRRIVDTLGAHWIRKFGERHSVTLSGTGQKALYDSSLRCVSVEQCTGSSRLNDYTYGSVQVDWTRLMNERTSTQLSVFATRFESEQPVVPGASIDTPERQSDTLALQGGLIHVFNERLRGTFLVGVRQVESKQECLAPVLDGDGNLVFCLFPANATAGRTTESSGGLGSAGLNYAGERLELDAALSRKLIPSGVGILLDTNEIVLDLSYRLRERLDLRLHARALDSDGDDTASGVTTFSREHYEVRPHARWQFRQNWWLDGGVEVRSQELSVFNGIDVGSNAKRANANIVFISVGYRTDPIPVFR